MNKTVTILFGLLTMLLAGTSFSKDEHLLPIDVIKFEMGNIKTTIGMFRLYKKTGESIRDGKCSNYWRTYKRELKEFKSAKNSYYKEQRRKSALSNLKSYKSCFTKELKNRPDIYFHETDPAKTYEQFISNYKAQKEDINKNKYQARYHDLKKMLDEGRYIKN
ncbi:MAG: hypothetical protein ABW098_17955 [Candidatus Thiodiazotropha sp.]